MCVCVYTVHYILCVHCTLYIVCTLYTIYERLRECGLTTLKRLRGDQIEVVKLFNGYENVDKHIFSHSRKIVELEDILTINCVTASSVNMFKNKVDTYLRRADFT